MQTIIRMNGKNLSITSNVKTYQSENNADELLFLLPTHYGELSLADCSVAMYWKNIDDQGDTIVLQFKDELYQDTYLQASVTITNKFTQMSGDITFWLAIVQPDTEMILKTSKTKFPVLAHSGGYDEIPEGQISVIDALNMQIQKLDAQLVNLYETVPTIDEINELIFGSSIDGGENE